MALENSRKNYKTSIIARELKVEINYISDFCNSSKKAGLATVNDCGVAICRSEYRQAVLMNP